MAKSFKKQKPQSESEFKGVIRDLGLKVTQQRLAILRALMEDTEHFTAQGIFEVVSQEAPDIGFATVYRFLRTLSENGYVTEVRMGGLPARYEWANKEHHDHLTCLSCNKIYEFENEEIERLQQKIALSFGFQLVDHLLELYGHCSECLERGETTKPKTTFSPSI